jgi:hypothetical protein
MRYEIVPIENKEKEKTATKSNGRYEIVPLEDKSPGFWEQAGKGFVSHAVGGPGSYQQSFENAANATDWSTTKPIPGEFEPISFGNTPLPTVESMKEHLGMQPSTSTAGRYGEAVGGGAGNMVLAALSGNPATMLGVGALGGAGSQTVREMGGGEVPANIVEGLIDLFGPGMANKAVEMVKNGMPIEKLTQMMESQVSPKIPNIFEKKKVPEYQNVNKAFEKVKEPEIPFGEKPKPKEISATTPISPEKTAEVGKRELAPQGPTSVMLETKRSVKPEGRVGESLTRYKISSKKNAAQDAQRILRERSEAEHQIVNEKYDLSEKLNSKIMGERHGLLNDVEDRLADLERQGARKYDAQAMDILEDLRDFLKRGPASNQDLINRERQVRKYLQHKYAHDPKNVFIPVIQDIQKEIARSAKGDPNAYQSYINAKAQNVKWNENYNNKYIRKFLDKENKDYQTLYNGLTSEDEYGALSKILEEHGSSGKNLSQSLKREMVEKDLKSFLYNKDGAKNSNVYNSPEFREKLQEIDYLNSNEKHSILNEVKSWRSKVNRSAKQLKIPEKKKNTKVEKAKKTLAKSLAHEALSPFLLPHVAKQAAVDYFID